MFYCRKVEEYSVQLKAKTEILYKLLVKVTANTNITPQMILEDKFMDSWSAVHDDIVDKGIKPKIERCIRFQANCQKLEEKVSAIFKQQTINFDTKAMTSFSSEMQKQCPQNYHQMGRIVEKGQINLDHILQVLPVILPSMLQLIESYKPRSIDAMSYESKRLQTISSKADELLQRTLMITTNPERIETDYQGIIVAPEFKNIQSMILSTPTISHDAIRRAENASIQPKRISLLEDAYSIRPASSMLSMASKPLNSILENSIHSGQSAQKQFLSPTRLPCKEPRTKLDPMAILQSITKKEKKDKHIVHGGSKAKAMNVGLRFGIGQHLDNSNQKSNDTTLSVPDFSSTLLNHSHDIKDIQFSVIEQINISLSKSASKLAFSNANEHKIRSLRTVDTFERSDRDINSSPSGRIEPLFTSKFNLSGIKPIESFDKHSEYRNVINIQFQRRFFLQIMIFFLFRRINASYQVG